MALACSFSPSMPAYSEKGVNKSYTRGACIFLAASSHEEGLAPPPSLLSFQTSLASLIKEVLADGSPSIPLILARGLLASHSRGEFILEALRPSSLTRLSP